MKYFYIEDDPDYANTGLYDNDDDDDVVDTQDDDGQVEQPQQKDSKIDKAKNAKDKIDKGKELAKKGTDAAKKAKKGADAAKAAQAAGNAGKFAKFIAPLMPWIVYVIIAIAIIIAVTGLLMFILTMPGMIWGKIKGVAKDFGNMIINFKEGEENNVKSSQIADVAQQLKDVGYDLHSYGFLSDQITGDKNTGFKTKYGQEDINYNDFLDTNKREVDEQSLGVTPDGVLEDKDGIVYAESEYIRTYLVSDNYAYLIKNNNTNLKSMWDSVTSFRFFRDMFTGSWGSGLIGLYNEDHGIGTLGTAFDPPAKKVANFFLKILPFEIGSTTVEVTIDRSAEQMIVTSSPHGYWGMKRKFMYSLEGWTGRYGMPLEFLLSLHLTSMQPDLAVDLVRQTNTEIQMPLHGTKVKAEGGAKIDGTIYTADEFQDAYAEALGEAWGKYDDARAEYRRNNDIKWYQGDDFAETEQGIELRAGVTEVETKFDQSLLDDMNKLSVEFHTLIPYIYKVDKHWFRDVYFVDVSPNGYIQDDVDYEAQTGERWTLYETVELTDDQRDNSRTAVTDDNAVVSEYSIGGLGTVQYKLYYYVKDGNGKQQYDGDGNFSEKELKDGDYWFTNDDIQKGEDQDDGKFKITSSDGSHTITLNPGEADSVHKKAIEKTIDEWYEEAPDDDYDGLLGGTNADGKWMAYKLVEDKSSGWQEYEAGEDDESGITNVGSIYYKITYAEGLEQIEDGQRGPTNATTKKIFSINKYYIYNGTDERAIAIDKDRYSANVKGPMEEYNNGNYDTSSINNPNQDDPRDENLLGQFSVDRDSLSAFNILTSMGTMDADSIYRDFKELIVELNFFDKEDLTEVQYPTFEWPIPEEGSAGWPIPTYSKKTNEYGTLMHSELDLNVLKEIKAKIINDLYEGANNIDPNGLNAPANNGTNNTNQNNNSSNGTPLDRFAKEEVDPDIPIISNMMQGVATKKAAPQGQSSRTSKYRKDTFLETAQACWEYIVDANRYTYAGAGIPVDQGSTVDCSSYVSWCIYEYGYDDFAPAQHCTGTLIEEAKAGLYDKYGWEIIEVGAGEDCRSKLQPGDILVRDNGGGTGANGHTQVVKEVTSGNEVIVYDCGSAANWTADHREGFEYTSFAASKEWAGVIIRIEDAKKKENTDPYTGFVGGEYVVSPVTGIVLQAGTDQKIKNIETGKEEEVGFIKIRVLDAIDFNKIFGAPFTDNPMKDTEDADDLEGFKYFLDEYMTSEVAGNTFYMEGFSQELFNQEGLGEITMNDATDNCHDESGELINLYTPTDYSEVFSKKAREQLQEEEKKRTSALPVYETTIDGKKAYLIKEGTVIGTCYGDGDKIENALQELKDENAAAGISSEEQNYTGEESSSSGGSNNKKKKKNNEEEEDPLADRKVTDRPGLADLTQENIKDFGNGNYIRFIMRTAKDGTDAKVEKDSIVENVENYLEVSPKSKKKNEVEFEDLAYYLGCLEEGFYKDEDLGDAYGFEVLEDGAGNTTAFGLTSAVGEVAKIKETWPDFVTHLQAGSVPKDEAQDVFILVLEDAKETVQEKCGEDIEDTYLFALIDLSHASPSECYKVCDIYNANHTLTVKDFEDHWGTNQNYARGLQIRGHNRGILATEGRYLLYQKGSEGKEVIYETETPWTDFCDGGGTYELILEDCGIYHLEFNAADKWEP